MPERATRQTPRREKSAAAVVATVEAGKGHPWKPEGSTERRAKRKEERNERESRT